MHRAERSVLQVEGQHDAQRHSGQGLSGVALRIDAVGDLERLDRAIRDRAPGSRPGLRRLLTERRDAMRALAAQLAPTSVRQGATWL
jgi:hypothetical protein